jgi:hypothetical protein
MAEGQSADAKTCPHAEAMKAADAGKKPCCPNHAAGKPCDPKSCPRAAQMQKASAEKCPQKAAEKAEAKSGA